MNILATLIETQLSVQIEEKQKGNEDSLLEPYYVHE